MAFYKMGKVKNWVNSGVINKLSRRVAARESKDLFPDPAKLVYYCVDPPPAVCTLEAPRLIAALTKQLVISLHAALFYLTSRTRP